MFKFKTYIYLYCFRKYILLYDNSICKAIDLNIKLIVCFLTLLSLISIFFYNMSVFLIVSTVLLLIILYLLRNFKLFKNDLLNYLKLFVLINLSLIVLDILSYRLGLESLILLGDILKISIYLIIYVWISEMLITKPYKTLHEDIIDKNKKLKILNKKMEESNNEFKEFKKKLRDNEIYFKNFLNNAPMSIVILNSNNHRIFTVNKRFSHELNLKSNREVINKNLFKIINIENKEEFLRTKKGEASFVDFWNRSFLGIRYFIKSKGYLIISMKNITELKFSEKIKDNLRKRTSIRTNKK